MRTAIRARLEVVAQFRVCYGCLKKGHGVRVQREKAV